MGGAMSSLVLSGDTSGTVTVTVPAVAGTNTVTIPATTGNVPVLPTGYTLGGGDTSRFKNRIINGDMKIDQRNSGASITPTDGQYSVDRWRGYQNVASKFSMQQNAASVTPPQGFINYLGATSLSAYSPTGSQYFFLSQAIEGLNVADLGWGTANAKTVTLSFWVRSSLTGQFGAVIYNNGYTRSYPILYTITSANTWEQISITVAGDTSGTWLTTNGIGIGVNFCLGAGSTVSATSGAWTSTSFIFGVTGQTQVVGTSGATFYITGVQLEVGSQATSFEYVDYTTQLAMCQRYYERTYDIGTATGAITTAGSITTFPARFATYFPITFKVTKRATPTITGYSPSSGASGNWSINNSSDSAITGIISTGMSGTCPYAAYSQDISAYLHLIINAEL
jgi:hypothetical protein